MVLLVFAMDEIEWQVIYCCGFSITSFSPTATATTDPNVSGHFFSR